MSGGVDPARSAAGRCVSRLLDPLVRTRYMVGAKAAGMLKKVQALQRTTLPPATATVPKRKFTSKDVILYARDLYVVWVEDPRYWRWIKMTDGESSSRRQIKVAKLMMVWWLHISGSYQMSRLDEGLTYRVVFRVMMVEPLGNWIKPVTMKIILPDKREVKREMRFDRDISLGVWTDLEVGEFIASTNGDIQYSLTETDTSYIKKGLIINSVRIEEV